MPETLIQNNTFPFLISAALTANKVKTEILVKDRDEVRYVLTTGF
jgi:hypothetical protein